MTNYGSISRLILFWRSLLYNSDQKIVPSKILNSNESIRNSFWIGLNDADGTKILKNQNLSKRRDFFINIYIA